MSNRRRSDRILAAGVAIAASLAAVGVGTAEVAGADVGVVGPTAEDLSYDMFGAPYRTDGRCKDGVRLGAAPFGAHEALPAGLPTDFDWYHGSRFGENPPWDDFVIPWGQAFAVDGNTEWDVRLQVREVNMMYLDAQGTWHDLNGDVTDSRMGGAFWNEYFAGQNSTDAEEGIRDESANGGGWSVRLSSMKNKPNYVTWHWFYDSFFPRVKVPVGAKAIFSAAQMRLISDGGDPADASFIASFGADHWPSETGGKPDGKQITPFYQPRMKYVEQDWDWFSGHTFSAWFDSSRNPIPSAFDDNLIAANPPPIVTPSPTTTKADPAGAFADLSVEALFKAHSRWGTLAPATRRGVQMLLDLAGVDRAPVCQ